MSSESGEEWGELICTSDRGRSPVKLVKAKCVIGRARDCDLHVESRLVSGHHCYLLRDEEGNVWIHDTSINSTFINRTTQVSNGTRHLLKDGDEVFLVMRKNNPDANLSFVFKCCDENKSGLDDTQEYIADGSGGDSFLSKPQSDKEDECSNSPLEPNTKRAKVSTSDSRVPLVCHISQTPGPSHLPPTNSGGVTEKKDEKKDTMGDSLLCCICYEILHDCVSLQPCMHSFCAGCYSLWMKKSNECPQCRRSVQRISKNHILNNLAEAYLKDHPDKMRSNSELDELNAKNAITHDMLYPKKSSSSPNAEYYSDSATSDSDNSEQNCSCDTCSSQPSLNAARIPHHGRNPAAFLGYCRQCPAYQGPHRLPPPETANAAADSQSSASSQEAAGPSTTQSPLPSTSNNAAALISGVVALPSAVRNHVCRPAGVHILCQCCMEPMPDRRYDVMMPNQQIPAQQCTRCLRFYCHLYWGCKKAGCLGCLNTFRNMNFGDKSLAGIINENPYESEVFKNYLTSQNLTWQDVVRDCLQRLEGQQYTCIPAINGTTVLCYPCALASFRQLAYSYRKDIPVDNLPADVTSRQDCYWGRNCRTQKTRPHHAKNFNHVCEQTRY